MSTRIFDDPDGTSDKARQGLLDNRSEHKPKRHRTLGRRKRLAAAKRQNIKHTIAANLKKSRLYKSQVRAYWQGAIENHPESPFT